MIHPTYRSLDAPVKLLGLSWRGWIWLIAGGGTLIGLLHVIQFPTKPAISACTIVIGVPLALAYLAEESGFGFGRLVADTLRWRLEPHDLAPGSGSRLPIVVVDPGEDGEAGPQVRVPELDW